MRSLVRARGGALPVAALLAAFASSAAAAFASPAAAAFASPAAAFAWPGNSTAAARTPRVLVGAPAVSLRASPQRVLSGASVSITGQATGVPAGTTLQLYASPYPYPPARLVATTVTSATSNFAFTVSPDRITRYRVVLLGTTAGADLQVEVIGKTITAIDALPLGRAGVKLVVFHPRDLHWGNARVSWSFAIGFHGPWFAGQATQTQRRSPTAIVLGTTITLPAGHFRWRACFHATGDQALLSTRRPPGCTGRGYHGGGYLPAGFPSPGAVARAASYLSGRIGRKAFAVVDSEGRTSGANIHWTFPTASVVKAMLLVGYLRHLHAVGQHRVDSYSNSFLYPMIHISDNTAATHTWSIVGDSGLYAVARAAGMTDFSVSGLWGTALLSPADQAHFFFVMDSLIPRDFVGYARYLLSTIEASQSWGIAAIARPLGYQAFFKDGSEPTGLGELVHQVDRLEGHGRTLAIAVMTDGDPTMQYGIDTIQGVAAALLGRG